MKTIAQKHIVKRVEEGSRARHVFARIDGAVLYFKNPLTSGIVLDHARTLTDDSPEWAFLTADERDDLSKDADLSGWVTRHGAEAAKLTDVKPYTLKVLNKSSATVSARHFCHRCGGLGYFPTKEHGACYECGGGRTSWLEPVKLYTLERIAKMDAANERRREKKAAEVKAKRDAQIAKNLEAFPEFQTVLDYEGDNAFITDIRHKAYAWDISEKQAAAVIDAVKRDNEKQAAKAEERANATPLTEGRQEFEGEVLTTKWQESDFGGCTKMLVKLDTGSKVWGTVPAAIDGRGDLKGCRVKFTGTLKVSDDDELFGFYSRPAKAEVIADAEGVA